MKCKLTPEQINDIKNALSEYDRIEIEPIDKTKKKVYNMEKQNKDIRCKCGKLVAIEKNGVIYVYCKGCKRQVPIY